MTSYREALLHLDGVEEVETKIKKKKKKKQHERSSSSASTNVDDHFEYLTQKETQISQLQKDCQHYMRHNEHLQHQLNEKEKALREMMSTAHHLSDIGAQEMNSIRKDLTAWKRKAEELARESPPDGEPMDERLHEALTENAIVRKQLDNLLVYQLGIQPAILEPLSTVDVVTRLERVLESVDLRIGSLQEQQECVLTFCDIVTGNQDKCIPFLHELNQKEKAINALDGKLVQCSQKVVQSLTQLQQLQQQSHHGQPQSPPGISVGLPAPPPLWPAGAADEEAFALKTRPSLCIQIWYALNELAVAVAHAFGQHGVQDAEYAKILQNAQQRCVWIVRNLFTSREKDLLCVDKTIYSNTTSNPPDPPTAVQAIGFGQHVRTSPVAAAASPISTPPIVQGLPPKLESPIAESYHGYILPQSQMYTTSPIAPSTQYHTSPPVRHISPYKGVDSPALFTSHQASQYGSNGYGGQVFAESPRVSNAIPSSSPYRSVTELSHGAYGPPLSNLSRKPVEPVFISRAPALQVSQNESPMNQGVQRNGYRSPARRPGAYQSPQRVEYSPSQRPMPEYPPPPGGPGTRMEVRRSSSNQPAMDPRKAYLRHPREFDDPARRRVSSGGRVPIRGRTASTSS